MSSLSERQRAEALGIGLGALGLLVLLALLSPLVNGGNNTNLIGPVGAIVQRWLGSTFGVTAPLVTLPAFVWGLESFTLMSRERAVRLSVLGVGGLLFLPVIVWLAGRVAGEAPDAAVGTVGSTLGALVLAAFGALGALLIASALMLALLILTLPWSPAGAAVATVRRLHRSGRRAGDRVRPLAARLKERAANLLEKAEPRSPWEQAAARQAGEVDHRLEVGGGTTTPDVPIGTESALAANNGGVTGTARGSSVARDAVAGGPQLADPGDLSQTELPPIDLLRRPADGGSGLGERELKALGEVLVDKLKTFRVEGRIGGWTTGPVVTQFEVVPDPGVKVGQIAALADDLALALRAPSVRIVAPIPGKGAVGVEVPNPEPQIVGLRDILEAPAFRRSRAHLPLALGRDLSGSPYCADLTRMPHLLIAGASGSGKSICINTIITSLVYRHTPRQLRLLLVDPKMVELVVYNQLPHLRHPVVTDNHEAGDILKWAVHEMGQRYRLLSANGCRNIIEMNRRIRSGAVELPKGSEAVEYTAGELPYIVLVIDELADLMMTVQGEVETPLAILAQKARAVGLHLVVATQRPSVNVITGLIKANFPCRIAFRVASKTDSRTILDQNGAESLLGNGDMLFLPPGEADPARIQGAYIGSQETERLVDWYRDLAARGLETTAAETDILEVVRELQAQEAQTPDMAQDVLGEWDELFQQAAEICITNDSGSTSLLQRRLKIGYGRAARIIDQLHDAGVLGPSEGSRPREVLLSLDELHAMLTGLPPV